MHAYVCSCCPVGPVSAFSPVSFPDSVPALLALPGWPVAPRPFVLLLFTAYQLVQGLQGSDGVGVVALRPHSSEPCKPCLLSGTGSLYSPLYA